MTKLVQTTDDYAGNQLIVHYYYDESMNDSESELYNDDGITQNAFEKGNYEILEFEFEQMKSILVSTIDQAEQDYVKGVFINYQSYKTSYGVQINSIEDVIRFIYAHEGFHWGIIVALKKIV